MAPSNIGVAGCTIGAAESAGIREPLWATAEPLTKMMPAKLTKTNLEFINISLNKVCNTLTQQITIGSRIISFFGFQQKIDFSFGFRQDRQ